MSNIKQNLKTKTVKSSKCIDKKILNKSNDSEKKIITSIYKITDEIKTEQELLEKIRDKLKTKTEITYFNINSNDFKGFLFSYKTTPNWANWIIKLLPSDFNKKNDEEKKSFEFSNSNLSYILIKTLLVVDENKKSQRFKNKQVTPLKRNMYVITGGLGYTIIADFIEKNFGLDLVPRLINNNDNVVSKVVEDRLMGNHIYTARRNKSNTNLNSESDFSNVYRELEFSANEDILLKLGIINSNEEKINKNIVSKDSFRVSKQLTIDELNTLIENLNTIKNEKEKFALNYFTPSKSSGFKNEEIRKRFKTLITNSLTDEKYDDSKFNFEIIGQNIANYPLNSKFEVKFELFNIEPTDEVISWNYLMKYLKRENITISEDLIDDLFYKSKLITYDNEGTETQNTELINCLDGFLKDENDEILYLRNGKWYIFNEHYINVTKEQYKQIYDDSMKYVSNNITNKFPEFKEKWKLFHDKYNKNPNENEYNNLFKDSDNIIFAHKHLYNKIEIADLILYDKKEEILYLFCLKKEFNGRGCRDLYGQIESSTLIIQNEFIHSNVLKDYYKELVKDNSNIVNENKFKNYFNKDICFVAGFLKLSENTESNYSKVLTQEISKKVKSKGYNFILMDFNFNKK